MNKANKIPAALLIVILSSMLFSLLLISCDGEDNEDLDGISRVVITAGNLQTERVGAMLPEVMTVRVTDLAGLPKFGAPVFFSTEDPGAAVNPEVVNADRDGYASATFRLGTVAGGQKVGVRSGTDSTTFNHTANALGCTEQNPESACNWPSGHVFITTTSSSLISGTGSALIDFDPETGITEKVLETPMILRDIDFSSRGEMYVTSNEKVYKVLPATRTLEEYADIPILTGSEIEFNMGGVLVLVGNTNVYKIGCPGTAATQIAEYYIVNYENLAVDPVTRDFYMATGSGPLYNIHWNEWDGMGAVTNTLRFELNTGVGVPRGMCVDTEGFLYVTVDSNGNSRSVARIKAGMGAEPKWFDFYEYFERNNQTTGRWGDITVHGDYLYLIDTRMNRLVVLDATGTDDASKYFAEYPGEEFSLDGSDSERYGIAAVPEWQSCLTPGM
jgi:sugar lactone lactonase YvrE